MCLEALDLTRGRTTHPAWGNFMIDEKGAEILQRKKLPFDLRAFIAKAVRAMQARYTDAEKQFQAMAALRFMVIQPVSPPITYDAHQEHITVPYGHRA